MLGADFGPEAQRAALAPGVSNRIRRVDDQVLQDQPQGGACDGHGTDGAQRVVHFDHDPLPAGIRNDIERLGDEFGQHHALQPLIELFARQRFAQGGAHDCSLALHHLDVLLRTFGSGGNFATPEFDETQQVRAAQQRGGIAVTRQRVTDSVGARLARQFVRRPEHVGIRCGPQSRGEQGQAHLERCHGVAEIVEYPFGEFGETGLVRLLQVPLARLGDTLHHAIEFARQLSDFVRPLGSEPHRQVIPLADRHGVARDPRNRREHDAVQDHEHQHEHEHGGADQIPERVAHGRVTPRRDIARNVDA